MVTNGINSLGLYGLNQNQSLAGLGNISNYGNMGLSLGGALFGQQNNFLGGSDSLSSMFSSMFGQQTNSLGDLLTQQSGNIDPLVVQKAIDINGNGVIEQNEIEAFLTNPTAVLQKAGITNSQTQGGNNQLLQTLLPILMQLLSGNKANDKATQTNTADIAGLKSQLSAAIANSDELAKKVQAQGDAVKVATDTAKKASDDAKVAGEKANASAQALINYKNSHGDEDPKLFAKEFGQLLDANKDAAVSRDEFKKIAIAAGEDLVLDKKEWDTLVDASKLADANKADLKAQVAENDKIDVKGLENEFFKADADKDGKVEAGNEINSFATDVASNDSTDGAVNTGDLAKESFETEPVAEAA